MRLAGTARAGNRRFWCLRTNAKAPYKTDFYRKTLRALNRPKAARTGPPLRHPPQADAMPRRASLAYRNRSLAKLAPSQAA